MDISDRQRTQTQKFIGKMINKLNEGEGLYGDYMKNKEMGYYIQTWYKRTIEYNPLQIQTAYNLLSDNGKDKNFDHDEFNIIKLYDAIMESMNGGRKKRFKSTRKRNKKRRLSRRR
jgi:hypothetical protein